MSRPDLRALLFVLCLAGGLVLARLSALAPAPRPEDAPPTAFSAGRALGDLGAIAQGPRPTGSAAAAGARAALLARMQALGLGPRVSAGEAVEAGRGSKGLAAAGGHVENLVGLLPGRDPALPVVLLMAHTDSVPASPGAADDGAGVVTALEVVRALKARGAPLRGVGVLLTDGEEAGLLGARAYFAGQDPLKPRIGAVINLEARGGAGRTAMFETGAANGGYMRLFARNVADTDALSMMSEIYKYMPNDTDFTVPRRLGLPGFNFAFIGALTDYHAPSSTIAALDKGSLQHMGDQALALAVALSSAPSLPRAAPDAVFGDLFGRRLVVYGAFTAWGLLLAGAGLAAAGAASVMSAGRERADGPTLARALAAPWLPVLAGALCLHLLHLAFGGDALKARALLAEPLLVRLAAGVLVLGVGVGAWRVIWRGEGRFILFGGALAAFVVIVLREGGAVIWLGTAAATALVSLLARRPLTAGVGWAGAVFALLILALGLQIVSPPIAPFAVWPLVLAGLMGLAVAVLGKGDAGAGWTPLALLVIGTLGAASLLRLSGMIADAIGYAQPEVFAILLLLGGAVLYPLAEGFAGDDALLVLPAPLAIALGAMAALTAVARDPFSARTPRPVEAFFVQDAREGRAYRASGLPRLDPWSKAVLEASAVPVSRSFAPAFDLLEVSPASLEGLERPRTEVETARHGGTEGVTLTLAKGLKAREIRLFLQPSGEVFDVRADGLPTGLTPPPGGLAQLRWVAPGSGLTVTFKRRAGQAVRVSLETIFDGLPPSMKTPPRTPSEAPSPRSDTSVEIIDVPIPGDAPAAGPAPGAPPPGRPAPGPRPGA